MAKGNKLKEAKVKFDEPDFNLQEPNRFESVINFIPSTSSVPTHTPKRLIEQMRIYKSGATIRLYIYDTEDKNWRYASLT